MVRLTVRHKRDGTREAIELLAVCVSNLWLNLELQHQTADSTLGV